MSYKIIEDGQLSKYTIIEPGQVGPIGLPSPHVIYYVGTESVLGKWAHACGVPLERVHYVTPLPRVGYDENVVAVPDWAYWLYLHVNVSPQTAHMMAVIMIENPEIAEAFRAGYLASLSDSELVDLVRDAAP